jgi:hypothetical protein
MWYYRILWKTVEIFRFAFKAIVFDCFIWRPECLYCSYTCITEVPLCSYTCLYSCVQRGSLYVHIPACIHLFNGGAFMLIYLLVFICSTEVPLCSYTYLYPSVQRRCLYAHIPTCIHLFNGDAFMLIYLPVFICSRRQKCFKQRVY